MNPHTIHLIAQFIRYQRGMLTSFERWASKQEPSQVTNELRGATGLMRAVLVGYEDEISRLEPPELREEALRDHLPGLTGYSVRERS